MMSSKNPQQNLQASAMLNGYFITRSYVQELEPFASILDLPKAEALQLTEAYQGKASDRTDDPEMRIATYYDHRVEVEDWLRQEAEKQNVIIKHRHALYFRLVDRNIEETNPAIQPHHVSIPISEINLASCTFTIGDSFCNYRFVETNGAESYGMEKHNHIGQVLTAQKADILEAAMNSGKWNDVPYIEVQLWDRPKIT